LSAVAAVDHPTPENLAAELAAMLRTGVTIDGCRNSRGVLSLALVRAKASSDDHNDLAVAANHLIREACASVDSLSEGPTAVLLAVAPGYRGTRLKKRREDAAGKLFITPGHLRDEREEPLLEAVADELYGMDSAYRLRHRHRTEGERAPQESGLRVNWLEQHRSYRRIWTPIMALRNDLVVLLEYFRHAQTAGGTPDDVADAARADISDRLSNMTWRLAQFSTALEQFVECEGGLWILADAESEIRVADAIYQLDLHLPFGEADVSWARLLLKRTEQDELDPYVDLLIAEDERRREFMRSWVDWSWEAVERRDPIATLMTPTASVSEQRSDTTPAGATPRTDCGLWLAAAQEFISLVDSDWYRMADWYREAPTSDDTVPS